MVAKRYFVRGYGWQAALVSGREGSLGEARSAKADLTQSAAIAKLVPRQRQRERPERTGESKG